MVIATVHRREQGKVNEYGVIMGITITTNTKFFLVGNQCRVTMMMIKENNLLLYLHTCSFHTNQGIADEVA